VTGVLWPSYGWLCAPAGLATRRQLRAQGLTPGRAPIRGEIVWRRGQRVAYLYAITEARAKRPATPRQLAALAAAMRTRRTCPACGRDIGYCLPHRWTACLDCQHHPYPCDAA
jgi:hypothetical protein